MNIPLGKWSGSDATEELRRTVIELNETTTTQTSHIIKLTYAILFLTFVMACMVGTQIWMATKDSKTQIIEVSEIKSDAGQQIKKSPSDEQNVSDSTHTEKSETEVQE